MFVAAGIYAVGWSREPKLFGDLLMRFPISKVYPYNKRIQHKHNIMAVAVLRVQQIIMKAHFEFSEWRAWLRFTTQI